MDLEQIAEASREYHDELYARAGLFEAGSWLSSNDKNLEALARERLANKKGIHVLDLGCGVGRNSIPIAKIIKPNGGIVVCVDILPLAIEKLRVNAARHTLDDTIESHVGDIAQYPIARNAYDLIIAHSALEHGVVGKEAFTAVLRRFQEGTKSGGINYLGFITSLTERDAETLEVLPAEIGFNPSTEEMAALLADMYRGWQILHQKTAPGYEERFKKRGRLISWSCNFYMFAAEKIKGVVV